MPKFQLLKWLLSKENSLQRSPEFAIDSRHFETNIQWPGRARLLIMTTCCPIHLCWQACFALKDMADRPPVPFKAARVPNPEDCGNWGVNDHLDGTFWCTCERCEIMPLQREWVGLATEYLFQNGSCLLQIRGFSWRLISWNRMHFRSWNFGE